MKRTILHIVFIFCAFLVFSGLTYAVGSLPTSMSQEVQYALPYPGMLPDNPLYPLKVVRDRILVLFTRDPVQKIRLSLLLSDKRLSMGKTLWDDQNQDLAISTISKGEVYLWTAVMTYEKLSITKNAPPGLIETLETACKKHEQVIERLIDSTTNETKKKDLEGSLAITKQTKEKISSLKH